MDEADHHRRVAEHEINRHEGQKGTQRVIDDAVAAQHDGPGEDAHQAVAPERQDNEQKQRLAGPPLHLTREHIGAGIADQNAGHSDDGGEEKGSAE